ncbi:hypothetical protein THAOC_20629 [Thalassiosira oceanica]|uniref:Uncharacterized protein n=1 Tax=Thalassiosira oceanica TaxID=159749 RepID=K0SL69_THAOC|nr:hypothetical protein THAOC_20629 [Thalassiosira oceanica]|eukprot:EJK59182.1 hypothetical protein THAOC_20629 [Thalassiosira oceanica]
MPAPGSDVYSSREGTSGCTLKTRTHQFPRRGLASRGELWFIQLAALPGFIEQDGVLGKPLGGHHACGSLVEPLTPWCPPAPPLLNWGALPTRNKRRDPSPARLTVFKTSRFLRGGKLAEEGASPERRTPLIKKGEAREENPSKNNMAAGDSDPLPPSGRRTDQGRILRVHFACRAPLPIGSTLRVTSSVHAPPLLGDGPSDVPLEPAGSGGAGSGSGGDDQSSVASGDILGANRRSGLDDMSISRMDEGGPGTDRDQRREELRMQSRLLTNTVEMTTTPDEYPLWRTTRPVVVIDTGGEGDLTELERMGAGRGRDTRSRPTGTNRCSTGTGTWP